MDPQLPITRTKIIIPRRRGEILSRQRLLRILDDSQDDRLVIVAAPAGYGKTSLLVDYVHQCSLPVCWLSLDLLDRDPQRMIAHFIYAIRQVFPEFGKSCITALAEMPQNQLNLDALVSLIVNDAFDVISEHFLFVLDDYHLVEENADINYFINRFLMTIDENCHLVISSRGLLPLPDMPLLVARGQVGGLGFEELAFNPEEIKDFYLQNHHVSLTEQETQNLAAMTEGWITGLILSTQISGGKVSRQIQTKNVSGVGLYDYLAHQVLEKQPDDLKAFLYQTSLLEEYDAELCRQVIGQALGLDNDWPALMQRIQRNNLFVLPVGEGGVWLRYHHLFRDFLQSRMVQQFPEDSRRILFRLAEYYSQCRDWERAHQVYERIGSQDCIAQMIEQAGTAMISSGRLLSLRIWIEELPGSILNKSPQLLSLLGAALVMLGDPKKGIRILSRAVQSMQTGADTGVLAHTYVRRSGAYRLTGEYTHSLEDAEEAIQMTARQPALKTIRASAYYTKGSSLHLLGNLKSALDCLTKAREGFQSIGDLEAATKTAMEIGLVYRHLGQYDNAEESYREALGYYQSTGNIVWQANLLNNLGVLHNISGDYENALLELEQAIQYANIGGYLRLEGYGLVSLGDLFKDLKAFKEADEAYRKADVLLQQINDPYLEFFLDLSVSDLELQRGRITRAKDMLTSAQRIASQADSQYQINLCQMAQGKLAFFRGDSLAAVQILTPMYDYFAQEGHQVEALKCKVLLGLGRCVPQENFAGVTELRELNELFREEDMLNLLANIRQPFDTVMNMFQGKMPLEGTVSDILAEFSGYLERHEKRLPSLRKELRHRSQIVPISAPELTVFTFGKIQVKSGDHIISGMEWKSQNARDLMLLLMIHPEGKSKEDIGEIFWPESSPEELRLRFKNTIYRLRHAAGKDVILFVDDIYYFNRGLDYEADFETFTREIGLAQKAEKISDQVNHYRAALKVYIDPFLPDLEEEWAIAHRERFHQMYIDGCIKLAELHIEQGEYSLAVGVATQLLSTDHCNEHMTRIAMRAHAAMGNQAGVIRQYETCVQALKDELNTRPSPQTIELYKALSRERRGYILRSPTK